MASASRWSCAGSVLLGEGIEMTEMSGRVGSAVTGK